MVLFSKGSEMRSINHRMARLTQDAYVSRTNSNIQLDNPDIVKIP